jgi:hypothetical protein
MNPSPQTQTPLGLRDQGEHGPASRLTAILFADVAEYSAAMNKNELATMKAVHNSINPKIFLNKMLGTGSANVITAAIASMASLSLIGCHRPLR